MVWLELGQTHFTCWQESPEFPSAKHWHESILTQDTSPFCWVDRQGNDSGTICRPPLYHLHLQRNHACYHYTKLHLEAILAWDEIRGVTCLPVYLFFPLLLVLWRCLLLAHWPQSVLLSLLHSTSGNCWSCLRALVGTSRKWRQVGKKTEREKEVFFRRGYYMTSSLGGQSLLGCQTQDPTTNGTSEDNFSPNLSLFRRLPRQPVCTMQQRCTWSTSTYTFLNNKIPTPSSSLSLSLLVLSDPLPPVYLCLQQMSFPWIRHKEKHIFWRCH